MLPGFQNVGPGRLLAGIKSQGLQQLGPLGNVPLTKDVASGLAVQKVIVIRFVLQHVLAFDVIKQSIFLGQFASQMDRFRTAVGISGRNQIIDSVRSHKGRLVIMTKFVSIRRQLDALTHGFRNFCQEVSLVELLLLLQVVVICRCCCCIFGCRCCRWFYRQWLNVRFVVVATAFTTTTTPSHQGPIQFLHGR
jgi:hypothetical protein